jgi:two-component sensor histidine kinase
LGSLCVIDTIPRPGGLTASQTTALITLGQQVTSQLELRRAIVERDILAAERREAEAQQEVLNEELAHRLKNTFAIIQAVATQTLRGIPDQVPVDAFLQRLHALSAAHDVLLQKRWAAANLGDIVTSVIATLAETVRFEVSGPEVEMGPRATLSISLLLHELTTNALKYGSLSNDIGRVRISWHLNAVDDEAELALDWGESGGPPVQKPASQGFGSKLIRVGLVGTGGVDLRYPPTGLEAEFRAPLAQVQLS